MDTLFIHFPVGESSVHRGAALVYDLLVQRSIIEKSHLKLLIYLRKILNNIYFSELFEK